MPTLSVVTPVYRSEGCLRELYDRLTRALDGVVDDYEIIMVDDRSPDDGWRIIREIAAADPRVKGVRLSRNFGQQYAIVAGLDQAEGDWVVVMDCDLQDPPEAIPDLYRKAQEGHDVVLALRSNRRDGVLKRWTASLFYRVFSYFTDFELDGRVRNFRIMSRNVVDGYCSMREHLRFFLVLVDWMGFEPATLEVPHDERFAGETGYDFGKLWNLGVETILAYSERPLRLAIRVGLAISALSLLAAAALAVGALLDGYTVTGWASLIVSLYLMSGVIISFLGILGLYLGKTFSEVKRRPLYFVSERT